MIIYQKIKDPLITQRVLWWSVGGSNLQAIAEHVEIKGGKDPAILLSNLPCFIIHIQQ